MSSKPWSPWRRAAAALSGVALAGTIAACSRAFPASFPPGAAASPEAAEAPTARVGVALAEDPPLPGESTAAWPGLAGTAAPADEHAHHHHHGAPEQGPADGGAHGGHAH